MKVTKLSNKLCMFGMGLLAASVAAAAPAPGTQRNFVSCPIVMDTLDVPCWVAEYEGERYFLTVQTGRTAGVVFSPALNHKVLVEGTVTDAPRMCGGIVLKDVKLSVMEYEVSPECNTILPGDGYHVTGPRPIGPDGDPPGERTSTAVPLPRDPQQSGPAIAARMEKAAAAKEPMEFVIGYFFDTNYLPFPVEQATVDRAADYAALSNAKRVDVVGYRGSVVLSNGEVMTERAHLPEARARLVADILHDFGVPAEALNVTWVDEPQHAGGVRDYEKRRVVITVVP